MLHLQKLDKEIFLSAIDSILANDSFVKFIESNDFYKASLTPSTSQSFTYDFVKLIFENLYKANSFACLSWGIILDIKRENLDLWESVWKIYNEMSLLALLDTIYFNLDDRDWKKYCDPKIWNIFIELLEKVRYDIIYSNNDLRKEYKF